MISEATLKSWYEDNASRPFPLAESVMEHECPLPFPVLVGLSLSIPSTMLESASAIKSDYTLHVSSVVITTTDVTVTVSAGVTGAIDVARMTTTMTDLFANDGESEGYELAPLAVDDENLIGVVGRVYLGPAGVIQTLVGAYAMDSDKGLIDLACIHPYPDSFRGLSINGKLLTGNITFVEGENVSIAFNASDEIVIDYTPPALEGITSVGDLVTKIVEYYGQPVLSINGAVPNVNGEITIAPAGESGEGAVDSCVHVETIEHGVVLSNPCATPCCDKEAYLASIATSINELNVRAARLSSYLTSVSTNLNALQNELGILKLGIKQQ